MMTQEDKELLINDLSSRLLYGVRLLHTPTNEITTLEFVGKYFVDGDIHNSIERLRPYLFPMSYIDDNEKLFAEYITTLKYDSDTHSTVPTIKTLGFYRKYHIDYRGLIPQGLAIDATGKNIY